LVGGSEAPLTDFTIAQMRALKIYSRSEEAYPNRADLNKTQSTILGEGECLLFRKWKRKCTAFIEGIGMRQKFWNILDFSRRQLVSQNR
jgi:hypothetical protein